MTAFSNRNLTAEYRYFAVDIMTNELLAELPLTGVSYGRSLREAGTFSGSIVANENTFNLNLYANTLPGKTAIYVTRNGICVWGGIIWTRSYSIGEKTLEISASEFTSYLYKRVLWKTWSNAYQASIVVTGGVAQVTLDFVKYDFTANMPIYIDWGSDRPLYAGYYTVLSSPAPATITNEAGNEVSRFSVNATYVNAKGQEKTVPDLTVESTATVEIRQDTYDYARDLLTELVTDLYDFDFPNDEIRPGIDIFNEIQSYSRVSGIAYVTTKEPHILVPGQKVSIADLGNGFDDAEARVIAAPTDTTFHYENAGPDVAVTNATSTAVNLVDYQRKNNVVTFSVNDTPPFAVGDIIFIDELNASLDGFHTVYTVGTPLAKNFQIVSVGSVIGLSPAGDGDPPATATVAPSVSYATWGEYTNSGDLGIEYSTIERSQKRQRNKLIRGFELKTIGEILEEYSNVPDGFEYRIDCTYDPTTNKFKRTFVFLPIKPTSLAEYIAGLPGGKLPAGEFAPVSAYGADKIVFEYPGNVLNATLEENAQDAATRFWVQGDDPELSNEASQPYAGATDTDLLLRGWPILEEVEKVENIAEENTLHTYAERFLAESRPPISNFSITVNGSLTPEVGSYKPGDWCSVIINDDFVRLRMNSYIELNDGVGRDVLLRKIDAYEVTVPDNPAFPEEVSLQLVTEAEVDKIGD